jgi:sugar lactone lactonase YvrE
MNRQLRSVLRRIASAATVAALAAATLTAPAAAAPPFPDELALPNGWAPEGITAGRGTTVYVGSLADGAIWRANVRTGDGSILVEGEGGMVAVGVEYEAGADRLWVAGGPTGQVRVYDASSGELLETYTFSPAGFLNDLVVTSDAVYVTDSMFGHLDVIPLGDGGALPDPADVEMLEISGDFELVPGFNLNGIVATRGWLIAVQSNTGTLFRIDPETGEATEIALLGTDSVSNGDGLELRGSTLFVVRNQLNLVAEFKLGPQLAAAILVDEHTSSAFDVPTTAAWVAGALYLPNARFGTPVTPDTEYTINRLEV